MIQKRLLTAFFAVALVAVACGGAASQSPSSPGATTGPGESTAPSAAPTEELATEQVYRVDLGSEPPTLDPTMAQDSNSIAVLYALNRGLYYLDKDLKAVPELATSVDISSDAKTFTFHLRDGATYSNGDPIKAGDLVYSWKRLMDPRLAAPYSYVLEPVVGASDLLAMLGKDPAPSAADIQAALDKLGVKAVDDKTFEVTLATPATYFLTVTALWPLVPLEQKWVETPNFTEAANYVSSGPFKLDSWEHNSKLAIVPSDKWYGDVKPTLQKVEFSMLGDPAAAQTAYEAGELDVVLTPSEDIARVKNDPELGKEVKIVPSLSITYYGFNNEKKPTNNLDFRIALTQSIDKQAFIDTTFGGNGVVANSFIMPGIPGSDDTLNPYPFDLNSAKDHMTKALTALGVSDCKSLGKLPFGFNSGAGHEPRVAFLAEAWTQAFGCEFDQQGSEFATFLQQRHKGAYIISRNGWGADYPHASNQLQGLFTCGGGNNDEQYCNKDFDALVAQAAQEPDQDKQIALYKQAQEMLMKDAPMLPLRFAASQFTIRPWVSGLQITPQFSVTPGDQFYETIKILKH
jgi:oligopeptide transport system substrate-binding protein